MSALLIKDLRRDTMMIGAFFVLGSLFYVFYVVQTANVDNEPLAQWSTLYVSLILLVMLVYGTVMHVEKHEEKNRAYEFLNTLPVTDLEIVGAKYLLLFLLDVAGIVYVYILVRTRGAVATDAAFAGRILVIAGSVSLVLGGLFYWGIFRLGYAKLKTAIVIVYMILLVAPQLTVIVSLEAMGEAPLQKLIEGIADLRIAAVVVPAMVVYCAFFAGAVRAKRVGGQ